MACMEGANTSEGRCGCGPFNPLRGGVSFVAHAALALRLEKSLDTEVQIVKRRLTMLVVIFFSFYYHWRIEMCAGFLKGKVLTSLRRPRLHDGGAGTCAALWRAVVCCGVAKD